MAYHQAELSFTGIHLAALTGENGAGKSSLLDAITWAIWGRARAKRDDELIRLGQAEMEVEFTFGLNHNVYRIVRKRESSRRGRTSLSLHLEDAGGWRTLTEPSVRATEIKISQLMRLDYDTFINSAFLLQGRADEFTTKRPAERKKILSDILGLELYEVYAERAKAHAQAKEKEAIFVTAEIQQIERELAREDEYRAALAAAEQEVAARQTEVQQAEQQLEVLRTEHRLLNDKQRQLEDLEHRLEAASADLAETAEAVAAARWVIDQSQAMLARRAQIEAGLQQLAQAQAAVQDWDNRLLESARLADHKHELDRRIQAARARLEADLRAAVTTINMVQPKAEALPLVRQQLAATQTELAQLAALEAQRQNGRDDLSQLGEEAARLAEQNKQLKLEMDEIKENLTRLQQAGSICPVCRRPLDEDHRHSVAAQITAAGTAKGDLYRTNKNRLAAIAEQQKMQQQAVAAAERELRRLPQLQGKAAQLEQSAQEAEAAIAALAQAETDRAAIQQRLDNRDFAVEALADLAGIEAELAALGYNKTAHEQARAQAEQLKPVEAEGRQLAGAADRAKEEEKRLEREQARYERLLQQTAGDRAKVDQLKLETDGLAQLVARLQEASQNLTNLQREYRFAREKVGMAKQNLNNVAYQAKERGKLQDKLQQIKESAGLYRELQTAFGQKGVQALLIESAIPEIEDEANQLLSRMTDGRMNLRFETQREARSSDSTIETLDILIADEAGTRDYELYSGGEAFRINFAIRIAISKVLARRAGARLQTLMIDEGFGTQDAQGRERLVEAINAIQSDFEKLIVITHIDELKDAFPVRIDVWKTANGSQVSIR